MMIMVLINIKGMMMITIIITKEGETQEDVLERIKKDSEEKINSRAIPN